MAVYQRYRKIEETEAEVTYLYGHPEMDRQLIFHKASGTWTVVDGREDNGTMAVIRGIARRWNAEATWPGGGGVQH
jgi:hypothetical protein